MTRFRQCFGVFVCLGLAALASVGGCGGGNGKPSEPLPCASGALLHVLLSPNVAAMTAPTFSICRNATCYAWTPAALLPASGSGGTTESVAAPEQILASLYRNSDGTITLDVEWHVSNETLLADGDHYTIRLADGSGAPAIVLDGIATYTRTTSTGLDSGAACVQAKLSA
jgi:hypothetical protein